MIRAYEESDFEAIQRMHAQSGLPPECLPDLTNPNFRVKIIADHQGQAVQAGFVKLTGEGYVLISPEFGEPGERLEVVERLIAAGLAEAASAGLDQVTVWIPPEIERSFGRRLESLGFAKSRWASYTANLR